MDKHDHLIQCLYRAMLCWSAAKI